MPPYFFLMSFFIETLIEYPNGGKIDVYSIVDRTADDYDKIYACCNFFALQGAYTLILPRFDVTIPNPDYHKIFSFLKGTPYWGRCPDFLVYSAEHKNGVWYEHEGYEEGKDLSDKKKRVLTFGNMIHRGMLQSERIIVEDCKIGRFYAKRNIFNRVHREKQNITEVYIRTDEGLEPLYIKGEG